jgi:hypothetical protein
MKYFTFWRESNKFADIMSDPVLKKLIKHKITWYRYLMIGIEEDQEKILSYITLKYGDEMKNELIPDRSPVAGVDYLPKR